MNDENDKLEFLSTDNLICYLCYIDGVTLLLDGANFALSITIISYNIFKNIYKIVTGYC